VNIDAKRRSDVAVTQHSLDGLGVRSLADKETSQAVTQVVEPETDLLPLH
jgi:hypothetical protein